MKVKMKASMRTLTRKGIVLLAKKTDAAAKAYEKAFLSPLVAQVAAGNIAVTEQKMPRSWSTAASDGSIHAKTEDCNRPPGHTGRCNHYGHAVEE